MKKVGLFFGSFNPIHIGHLIVANTMKHLVPFDEVWFVISPHNPFKAIESLLHEKHRLAMCKLALEGHDTLVASDIEFELEKPSYSFYTLKHLIEKYPTYDFHIIMGEDNLIGFKNWKSYQRILEITTIHVYKRSIKYNSIKQVDIEDLYNHSKISFYDVPFLDISSTYIRSLIQNETSIDFLSPKAVVNYIEKNNLYKLKSDL